MAHFKQRYSWDCGLSCVLMILDETSRAYFLNNFKQICREENFGESTWTIDLCYLLRRFNVDHKYMTTTIGINPEYDTHSYYDRIISIDEKRVNQRFADARNYQIDVEKRTVNNKCLVDHLANHGPIIVLTNGSLLTCDLCKANKLQSEFRMCFPWRPSYNGHYILVIGYNLKIRKFFYRNPTNADKVCLISFDGMTSARLDHGTDEDLIFVYKKHMVRSSAT